MLSRPDKKSLNSFWPRGNSSPIMFVNVVGEEGLDKIRSSKSEVKVGMDSKYNIREAELVVSQSTYCWMHLNMQFFVD